VVITDDVSEGPVRTCTATEVVAERTAVDITAGLFATLPAVEVEADAAEPLLLRLTVV
jgi:hypothetical protein